MQRQSPLFQQGLSVTRPLGMILIVDAGNVPETGHARGQQIGTQPQVVAVAEVHLASGP